MAVAVVVALLVALFLARTRPGKQMRAVADNRDLASVSGIDVERIGVFVWILAGGLAGLAGVMLGLSQASSIPHGVSRSSRSSPRWCWAASAAPMARSSPAWRSVWRWRPSTWTCSSADSPKYKPVLAFVVLILLLLYRPQGLFGQARGASDGDLQPPLGLRGGDSRHLHDFRARVSFCSRWPVCPTSATLPSRRWPPTRWPPDHPLQRPDAMALAGLLAAVLFSLVLGIPSLVAARRLPGDCDYRRRRNRALPGAQHAGSHRWPDRLHRMLGPSQLPHSTTNRGKPCCAPSSQPWSETLFVPAASRDESMLLIVWVIALILLVVFWLMVRSPWGG